MKSVLTKLAIATAALMGVATTANAFVVLTMKDLTTTTTMSCDTGVAVSAVNCNAGFFTLFANPNKVDFAGTIGGFLVQSTTGISNAPGNPLVATAGTTSLDVTRVSAGPGIQALVVDFIAYGFFNPTGTLKTLQGSASTNAAAGFFNSATESIFTNFAVDSDNGLIFAAPTAAISCNMATSINTSCDAGSAVWADPLIGVAGFSTRTQQRFRLESGSTVVTGSSMSVRNVPEPMTLSLVGLSLVGLGFASRRRAAAKA